MDGEWPIELEELGRISCGVALWSGASGLRATLVAKASFALKHGGVVELVDPWPVVTKERHRDASPWTSIVAADDLAPLIPGAGVVVTGHAHVVGPPVPTCAVRLALARGKVLLDKSLHVFGDRAAASPGRPAPFQRMPIDYEHTYGGPGFADNPLGRGAAPGSALPNVVSPTDPRQPAGFGPLARGSRRRQALLGPAHQAKLAEPTPQLGDDFPWGFFHAAPEDQRLAGLVGDEWLLLDGMHPAAARIQTQLPACRAVARVIGLAGRGPVDVGMRLDTLIVDADRQELSLVWRGVVELGTTSPAEVKAFVALELPGAARTAWPDAARDRGDPQTVADDEFQDEGTQSFTMEEAARAAGHTATPFVASVETRVHDEHARFAGDAAALPFVPAAAPFRETPREREPATASLGGVDAMPASRFFHQAARPDGSDSPAPPPDGPRPPPRASEIARVYVEGPLIATTLAWQIQPPADALVVIVKGSFTLVPDAPAVAAEETELPIGDIHVDDDPMKSLITASDFAVLKPKADVVLRANAHAPGGRSRAMQVTFRFGRGDKGFDRTLHVFGDRVWQKSIIALAPTDPAEFTSIPLTWERAFGGPKYEKNPAGVGHQAAAGVDGIARLPNVEAVEARVTGPTDAPPPAGFGPVPPQWKARWSKLGTYDRSWFKTRWPYWPKDFDWTYYQAAPKQQQLPYLTGDEPFELIGVTAGRPSLKGTLPGVKARAFVQRTPEADGRFVELPLVLDTVTFDAEALVVHLVWRGHIEVSDDDAPEVQHVFAFVEPIAGAPASLGEARARYLAVATPAPAEVAAPTTAPPPAPTRADLRAAQAAREEALEDAPETDEPLEPPMSPDEVAATMKRRGASDDDIAELLEILKPEPPPDAAPPEPTARERAAELVAEGAPFDGLVFDGAELSDLDFSGRSMVGASFVGANLTRARLAGASLVGARLERANLTLAVLDDADLRVADLKCATVDESSFARANAAGARFEGARGERAAFTELAGAGADFRDADLPRARFDGADLTAARFFRARVREARFSNAKMADVRFYEVEAEGALLDGIQAKNGRFEGAIFTRATFKNAALEGAVFERCKLDKASFVGADATGASFLRATGASAAFTGATLVEARLTRARFGGASFLGANLLGAKLDKTDLSRADFRKANLHAAGLWKAKIDGADFDGAILTKSTLAVRRPP